jgi:CRP/FNR family transcriptional regulator, polysaccharide utilization system transcription regulator
MVTNNCSECISRKLSIFAKCPPETLKQISIAKQEINVEKGEDLFHEGKHPRGLFCVQNGKIKVSQLGYDGKEQIVHLIKSGNTMGHRALFDDEIYSCSAIALDESKVCFIPKSAFFEILSDNGNLTIEIAKVLAKELKEAEQNITTTSQQSVEYRLIDTLIKLYKLYGFENDNSTINVKMTRNDIANLVGTTRETITRKLYHLQAKGLIALKGKKIQVLKKKKLESYLD